MTYRDIVALVGVNLATVMRVKKLKQEAGSVSCGRKKKTIPQDDGDLLR